MPIFEKSLWEFLLIVLGIVILVYYLIQFLKIKQENLNKIEEDMGGSFGGGWKGSRYIGGFGGGLVKWSKK